MRAISSFGSEQRKGLSVLADNNNTTNDACIWILDWGYYATEPELACERQQHNIFIEHRSQKEIIELDGGGVSKDTRSR
jgi:hypothetical protein